ncbi:MAG: lamin tail domain-containing protein [Verrucomicrobiaceae bacterium]|nr:lamin tail domain-containing protein [Verrucomicrobiaceae bacterium]
MKRTLLAALLLPLIGQAQTTEFGNLNVVQNDAGNATTSVTVTKSAGSSPNFAIRTGSNKADYNVTFGNTNDYDTGVLVAAVSENGRNNNSVGETIGTFYTTVGVDLDSTTTPNRYYLALFRAPNAEEQNQNVACAFFPYSQWLGGVARNAANANGGATDTLKASTGINLGVQFTTAGAGLFGLNLTTINAAYTSQNGILLVSHLKNEDNYAASFVNGSGFTMHVRDNGSTGTTAAPATEQDPIAFVYLQTADVGTKQLKAMGRVNSDASTDVSGGSFTVTKGGTGQWYLSIPGMSPATGTLIVSPEGGATNNIDNIISYQWDAANTRYVIESRDIVSATAAPVLEDGATTGEDMFSFAFFEAPVTPTVAITTPANGSNVITGAAFEVEATAADANGTVTQVEFFRNGTSVGTDATAPFSFSQTALPVGAYSFTARATDNDGFTTTSTAVTVNVTLDPNNLPANTALWFDGVNDYVTMGTALDLGVGGPPTNGLTLECWFRKDGAGLTSSSGSGGVTAVPLFGKGRGEGDGSNVDCNYFFGITTAGILVADFEAYPAAGITSGQNYPITATNTPITNGTWNHAAVTYDGTTFTWKMYLNGVEVGSATALAGALPRYDSIQHFGIGTAMTSAGTREGAFHGIIDEVRVWSYARSAAEITATKDVSVASSPGLVGRYGLNEGTGTTAASSTGTSAGTLTNGPLWIEGATLVSNDPPTVAITAPANNATFNAPAAFTIHATASDPDGTISKVEFFSGATKLGEDTTAPYSFDVSGLAQGSYSYTARATDNFGAFANSSVINVTVEAPLTTPPTVSITSPADGTAFLAPATILINANAADSDGTVAKVEFFNGATKLGEDMTSPYSFAWNNVAIGTYSLTAKATDDMTATTTSAAITVTVIANQAPTVTLASPADLATNAGTGGTVTLSASVADPESQPMTVTFYGRLKSPPVGPDFTLVTLPDTQFYSENTGGTRLQHFLSQTNWIVANRNTLNIPFVAHMGDMVQNGDAVQQEWINADSAMDIIEDPAMTLLTHGIPWGGAPGNHDQQPIGSPDGASLYWNTYFGTARWAGRPYWGGNYSTNNDNNYQLFSASGLDFIIINLEYRSSASQAVLDWADALLKAHPNRRAIITSHWLISTGNPATWGGHGQAVYDNLKDNPNLFLMLCGHIHGEGQRADVFEGRTVYTVLQDYQSRANGGDSWLRYFVFSPANNTITAKTLQTRTLTFETDADSEFTLPYTMGAGTATWTALGTVNASGGSATLDWTGLAGSTEYEWYAAVSDGTNNVGSTARSFTAAANAAPTVSLTSPAEGSSIVLPAQVAFEASAADSDGSVTKVEFFANDVMVNEDSTAPYSFSWTALSGSYVLKAVAYDNQGATTTSTLVNITVTNPNNQLPTVQLTSPAPAARVPATGVTISASASDADGVVTKVEFYDGVTKLGEDTTAPYSFAWTGGAAGPHTLTAVATDNDGATKTSTLVPVTLVTPESLTLITKGATWKYLDDGSDQGTAWKEVAFADGAWNSGPGPLGYGDTHIITTVNSGPSGSRFITTYLRRSFEVADASLVRSLALNLMRDDGAVIYINGTEVARSNMPEGPVNYLTNSATIISGTDETTYVALQASSLPLVNGTNSIAVELHNRDGASSDLGFDLEVISTQLPPAPPPQLLITEINSDGAGGDFWELTNIGASAEDLSGYKWTDSARTTTGAIVVPAGTIIASGESIIFHVTGNAAAFRSAWGIPNTVQVFSSGPGLGQNDAITLYNASNVEVLYQSYGAGGFTRSNGSSAAGGHAGASAGGATTVSMVWDPAFGTSTPRYGAAAIGSFGSFAHTTAPATMGSPGYSGFGGPPPSVTLSLSVTPSSFFESATNPAATGTVSRVTSSTSDLVVTLNSSDITEATVPATVTILANQTSATFDVTAVDDSFPDGDKAVMITATATGATSPTFNLTVQDDSDVVETSFMLTEVLSQQAATGVNDFWELTNISGSTKDISGYSWHDSGRSAAAAAAYKLPSGSSISPGESVIFTAMDPAAFRAWWGISNTVQVFQSIGAPGLGQNDGVSFFDSGGNELFFFSYAAAGFTKADGNPSTGTHAGPSAGAATETQSAVWVPSSGTTTPRYTFATVNNLGGIASVANAADIGSPGMTVGNPTVSIANASIVEGNSGTSSLALNVTRSDTATAFTVDYAVTGGTATSGTDFATLASGTLNFTASGAASQPINITVNGDTDSEPDETVVITLSNLVNTTGTTVIANASGTGTILNDDIIAPQITTQPAGTTIATGYTATLLLIATGTPAPTIQWYQGAVGTTTTPVGTNSSSFTTPALTTTTSFWARVSNAGGSVDSEAATITVTTGVTSVDLSTYVRVARINLPEYRRTALPPGTAAHNLLCDEASAVTYNWDTDTLFITGDGGRAVTQVSKTGQLIDTMSLELNAGNPQGTEFYDPEGLTYIGGGQFVLSEERERRLVKFTYAAGTTLTRAAAQTVDIGTFDDNTGTEGLSYDPQTSGFIVLKEKTPIGVFQTGVDFAAGTATNGSSTTVNSTNLFDTTLLGMTDVADVFALSNIPSMTGQPQAGNLLVLSQENARVVNIDRSGNILSTLNITSDPGNPLSAADQQHEGITMDRAGIIYVVNENGGGSIEYPQLWVYAPSNLPNQAPTAITLNNAVNSLEENTSTASPIKVADIVVIDDGLGANSLSLSGADAASFQLTGSALYLKSGVVLDFETKTSYAVTINADDTTVGTTPDVTQNFTLNVTDQLVEAVAPPALIVTEVAPWASGNGAVGGDWFEVTNISANAVDITGWKVDDSSNAFATAIALNGITSIAPGESVIFIESSAANQATIVNTFKTVWFGSNVSAGLQIGTYQGSGIGLSTGGDAVNLFTAGGTRHSGVTFGAADATSPYQTFDNTAAADNTAITLLSSVAVNGAFIAATSSVEIGSPGYSAPGVLRVTEVAPWSSGNSPVAADWFEVTNIGARSVDITGWKVDDSSESPAAALLLTGITMIAPGESVIFIETATLSTTKANFLSNWFGTNPPATLQVGGYTGGGIGLSTGGDAVNLYDTNNVRVANVAFGIAPSSAPYRTFDNASAANVASISTLSQTGVNGAFAASSNPSEIGSPGVITGGAVGFAVWLAQNGFTGTPGADSDNDGVSDTLEYFFNSSPNNPADRSHLPAVVREGGDLEFRFTRLQNSALTGTLRYSTDLLTWQNAVQGVDYEIVSQTVSSGEVEVRYRLLNPINAKFFQLRVE